MKRDLQELFEEACKLDETAREEFIAQLRQEDSDAAQELSELLDSEEEGPAGGSPTKAFEGRSDAEWGEFASKTIGRLGNRGDGHSRYEFKVAEGRQGVMLQVWDEDLQPPEQSIT